MLCSAQVDQTNIKPIEPGQRAIVYVNAYEDTEFVGRVERVSLKMDRSSDGVGFFETEIIVELSEGQRLYSGLSATADILVETFEDVLVVPSQAVLDRRVEDLPKDVRDSSEFVDREKTFASVVYVIEDGEAKARPVRIGASDLTRTVIEGGVEAGDRVVAGPYRVLVDLKQGRKIIEEGTANESDDNDNGTENEADADAAADDSEAADA